MGGFSKSEVANDRHFRAMGHFFNEHRFFRRISVADESLHLRLHFLTQWTPEGDAFRIGSDLNKLESETLPQYFRHSRFQSLVRQLNFYNVSSFVVLIWVEDLPFSNYSYSSVVVIVSQSEP